MIKRLLIANRGEIAVRVIRTCRELGIETVAVYSTADKENLHVRMADKAVCVGPPASAKSYLVRENLIMAALRSDCQAIHPGVGFLSENADFARAVKKEGLIFIGPDAEVIDLLGDKVRARETASRFGLPITPGTDGPVSDPAAAAKDAERLGYPVIIKAASGGGGKGMRIVRNAADLAENISIASREAEANFADGTVFMEKYLETTRHVELQILADGNGNVAVLGERDCSVQKRHQKLIEESPSPGVDDSMRARMSEGAVRMFRELKYRGAGTIEFLVADGNFYFMEVNARVQVEHPVSEYVTGVDIIRQQILACTEGRMEIDPAAIRLDGWAVECRINALTPGRITELQVPGGPGVRFDSFLYQGYHVPPHYDSMVAKLIVHAPSRPLALARMNRALSELRVEGIKTNRLQQLWIVNHPKFRSGEFGTSYYAEIEKEVESVR
ncbi:MAG: acetyl-CoA carboxylase biotin carboxylase subunit [Treponema sp. GWB1_62_6]|nr:MAG: acetyl-CoA carboxylase biotin carboxylase subunit [Treponema sp. GWC1_61_84]OHE69113.1 MAG: acetyl-CoA carboxylase biotin carboxylase subunit [Treponema sp. GWB1_62_6]OHE76336.1 MAG: acetyl-CoA carboxylase biotin carboxylase subunit [Treponema sp. RIFOXYC1_FULL_61_9]HCM26720.1 acetyl-CoA carboxylase biotin carboxylase subunit [Treponema sp.]